MGLLDGKVAVISGGTQGLGLGIAHVFGREGAKVAVIGRTPSKAEAFDKDMAERGYEAMSYVGDVTSKETVEKFITAVVEKWGTVDIDINCAGIYIPATVMETTDEILYKTFDISVKGSLYMMQACYPYFHKQGSGKVINWGSIAGNQGLELHTSYSISKAALQGLTRVAALEWARENIQVNCVNPAGDSPLWREWEANQPPEMVEAFLNQIPAHRMGDAEEDIGRAIAALCSDYCNWITSRTIWLDGGQGATR
ncbi:MAG: SDR family oxidoreductase [Eubacterium sp.]|nr:SDR family oxidoreductase [Eubacterium sp.]